MVQPINQHATETPEGRRTAPAAERNCTPLIEALKKRLPESGRVLEIASGTGQHAASFAKAFPELVWVPSDIDIGQRRSISAWRRESGLENLLEPIAIDVAERWAVDRNGVQTVLAINLLHLIPEPSVAALFHGARSTLSEAGRIIIYGPFLRGSEYASEGDLTFDASLRARDAQIGYKSVGQVSELAFQSGFTRVAVDPMPANNLLFTFQVTRPAEPFSGEVSTGT